VEKVWVGQTTSVQPKKHIIIFQTLMATIPFVRLTVYCILLTFDKKAWLCSSRRTVSLHCHVCHCVLSLTECFLGVRQRHCQKVPEEADLGKFPGEELVRKETESWDYAAQVGMWRRVVERLTSEFQRGREKGKFPGDPKEPL